jgi:tetratricopeptide (TPR) repeat protein
MIMVRSVGASLLALACCLAVTPLARAWPTAQEPSAPRPSDTRDADKAAPAGSWKEDRAKFFAALGEDTPQPFVPLHPRTVDDRKRVESITAYSVARALEDQRSWSDAIGLLEDALKLDPDSITVLRRLSRLCFILGRTEPAVKYSRQVLAVDPGDTDTISRLVGYYNRRNDPGGAESVLKDVLANPKLGKDSAGRMIAEFEMGKLYTGKLRNPEKAADAFAVVVAGLDDRAANRLSPADQRRILGADEAATYQEFGLAFLEAKRYDLAITAFERGLDYEPDDPQLPLLLAQTLIKVGKGEQALGQVERFLKRQPQGVEGYELLAKVLKELNREGEITPRLEQAAKNDSKNVALQYALADRYRETGQVERAEAMYKELLTAQPTTQGYSALAASLLKRKKAEELLKVISEAITRQGGFEAVQEQIKGIIDDPEFCDEVLEAGLKLAKAEPPGLSTPAVSVLAAIAKSAGKLEKFLPIQQAELKRKPTPQSYKELLITLLNLRRFGEVASTLEEMLEKFPQERNALQLTELARYYRLADKPEAAVKAAREALALDPNNLDAQTQLAVVLSQTGKADEAVEILRAAEKRDPMNPAVGSILGSILAQVGRNEEAEKLFKGLLDRFPNNDEVVRTARSNLSIIYVNLGDYARGEAELEALLERNPDEAGVNNDLGYLYAEQGKNLEKAETMIRKAVEEDPENSAYLDSLGWVLFKRGKVKEAVEPLEKAVKQLTENAGSDATIFEHLGDVYFQLQETSKAREAWRAAEKSAAKTNPPDKRLPEIRKKLESLEKLGAVPKPSSGDTP